MRLCTSKYSQCYWEPQQQELMLDSSWFSIPTESQTELSAKQTSTNTFHICTPKPYVSPELEQCAPQRKPLPTPSSAVSVRACPPLHCSFVGEEMPTVKHFPLHFHTASNPLLWGCLLVLSYPRGTPGKGKEQTKGGCGGCNQEESSPTPIWQKR